MSSSRSFGPACTPGQPASSTACLCMCHYMVASCDDAVCASTVSAAAAHQPLVARRPATVTAAAPRTIRTPLGPTTRFAIR